MKLAHNLKAQRGFVTLVLIAIFGAITLGYVLYESTKLTQDINNNEKAILDSGIAKAKADIESEYRRHASEIDSSAATSKWNDFQTWSDYAGVGANRLIKGQISNPIAQGDIQFKRIGIWIPGSDLSPTFDANLGTFSGCEGISSESTRCGSYAIIDGSVIEKELYERARENLQQIATVAEAYATGKIRYNPLTATGTSPFRPAGNYSGTIGCSDRAPDELPCLDSFVSVTSDAPNESVTVSSILQAVLGLPESAFIDPWGNPIQVSNQFDDPSNPRPPFTMTFKCVTPWGKEISITAFYRV